MIRTEANDCAFPCIDSDFTREGCTKREYFAALILSGIAADPNVVKLAHGAKVAVEAADFLIMALNGELL